MRALTLLQPVGYDRPMPVVAGHRGRVHQRRASARIRVRADHSRAGGRILFGGDLGRFGRPVLPDPTMVDEADYLLVESTYGDRVHEQDDDGGACSSGSSRTRSAAAAADHPGVRGRPGRGAALLAEAARGGEAHPGAAGVRRQPDGDRGAGPLHRAGARARRRDAAGGRATTRRRTVPRRTRTRAAAGSTRARNGSSAPSAPSASGRSRRRPNRRSSPARRCRRSSSRRAAWRPAGGSCITCAAALPDSRNTVLFAGYQAVGTRGRSLVDGAKSVKIHGQIDPGPCPGRSQIESMSAHADSHEIMRWLSGFQPRPAHDLHRPRRADRRCRRSQSVDPDQARLDDEDSGASGEGVDVGF